MDTHTRGQAFKFYLKSRGLIVRRWFKDTFELKPKKFPPTRHNPHWLEIAHSHSSLWSHDHPSEAPLTAGKVQNLRQACRSIDGILIPASEVFSFWKHIGRTTKKKGYVHGRELREGCIIPNRGGGLCQLSNALYDAALKSNLDILERHAHTRIVPGSLSEIGRDATVFWNYVDLRFSFPHPLQISAKLNKDQLRISFHSSSHRDINENVQNLTHLPADDLGNCLSCNVTACFRHSPQNNASTIGKVAALLDVKTPEFEHYIQNSLGENDWIFTPLRSARFPRYHWKSNAKRQHATFATLRRTWAIRTLPQQGALLQRTLFQHDRALAESYVKKLSPEVTHLIISINLLPHIAKLGALGGRTYDVLAHRAPLHHLQNQLDHAAARHPQSSTLVDFRLPEWYLNMEQEALHQAERLITAHTEIARYHRTPHLLNWHFPETQKRSPHSVSTPPIVYFPASPLARKGIYELADFLKKRPHKLLVLGTATENSASPLDHLQWQPTAPDQLPHCDIVILPAYIEHQPRLLLRALALGIPVIATRACGLPSHPNLILIESPTDLMHQSEIFHRLDNQ